MTTDQERIQRLEDSLRTVQERLRRLERGTHIRISTTTTDVNQIARLEEGLRTVEERSQSLEEGIRPRLERVEEDLSKIAPMIHSLRGQIVDRFYKVDYNVDRLSESAMAGWKQSSSHGVKMRIYVKTLTGKTVSLEIGSSDTIQMIKDLIQDREGIPAYKQRLVFDARRLRDEKTLADYDIENESTIYDLSVL